MSQAARRCVSSFFGIIVFLLIFCFFETTANAQITMRVFTDPHRVVSGGTIGFAFAGTKFVGSVQGDGLGVLYQTDLEGGNVQVFAPGVSVPAGNPFSEHFVASSLGLGGFPIWDVYVGAGNGVLHISNDGQHSSMIVTGLAGPVEAILFDTVGTFDFHMLVSAGGQVYRVDSGGRATLLASVGQRTEGMDVAPIGAGFGGFDGQLVVASENDGLLRAVSPAGKVSILNEGNPIPQPESVRFVPLNLGASGSPLEGFYSASFPTNVVNASATELMSFKGDAIVTTEIADRRISRIHWNGARFEITTIGTSSGQTEDGFILGPNMVGPGVCRDPEARHVHIENSWCAPNCEKIERRPQ